jgi:hypothetical protein
MRTLHQVTIAALLAALGSSCTKDCPPLPPPAYQTPGTATAPAATASATVAPGAPGYKGLGVESLAPEVLARHVAPPLDRDVSAKIQAMLDVRAPAAGIASPDGKRLYFTWAITGTAQIFRVDSPMGFPTQLTGGEHPTQIVDVTPDGKWLVVSRDRNGEENPGLYLLSPEGGALKVIQHKPKVQTQLNYLASDGASLYYRANDVTPDSYAIYKYDLASGKAESVFSEPGIWSLADVKGDTLLLRKDVGSNMGQYFEYALATKKLEPVIGKDEKEDYVARYGAGGELLVLTPKLGEYRRLYSLKAGKLEPITPDLKFDVSSFSVDRTKKRILYTVNEGGYMKLFGLDALTKKPLKLPALPAGDHQMFGATTLNGRYTSFQVDPGTAPAQSFVFDWTSSKLEKWHKPSTPELDTNAFAKVALESYPARDGTPIPMFVRRPAGCVARTAAEGPCPVIVSFHGGPEAQTTAGFSTRAQMFVDAGFVYAEPNVRGSDGYGKSWLHADDGPKRLNIITDIEDAARFVRAKWAVGGKAPEGRCVWGQLRRLLHADRDDDVRGRLRRRRVGRRDLEPAHVPREHRAVPPHPADLRVRRPGERSRGPRDAQPDHLCRQGEGAAHAHPGGDRSARPRRRGPTVLRGAQEEGRPHRAHHLPGRGPRFPEAPQSGARDGPHGALLQGAPQVAHRLTRARRPQ